LQEWAATGSSFVQAVQQLISDPEQQLPATLADPTAPQGQQQQQKLWATNAGASDVTFIITLYEHVAGQLISMRGKVSGPEAVLGIYIIYISSQHCVCVGDSSQVSLVKQTVCAWLADESLCKVVILQHCYCSVVSGVSTILILLHRFHTLIFAIVVC
jgi:hypothetical protein